MNVEDALPPLYCSQNGCWFLLTEDAFKVLLFGFISLFGKQVFLSFLGTVFKKISRGEVDCGVEAT